MLQPKSTLLIAKKSFLNSQLLVTLPQNQRLIFLDQGVGIPTEAQHKIFQPFFQADISVSRKYGGTGLGLTISKRLAEMQGGSMWFTSSEMGSTFFFTINVPIVDVPVPKAPWSPVLNAVVLEPSIALGNVLKKRMCEWGFCTFVGASLGEVEDFFRDNRVDILIIDSREEFKVVYPIELKLIG